MMGILEVREAIYHRDTKTSQLRAACKSCVRVCKVLRFLESSHVEHVAARGKARAHGVDAGVQQLDVKHDGDP
jgi:hypothetical protein